VIAQTPNALGGLGAAGQVIPGGTAAVPLGGGAGDLAGAFSAGAFGGSTGQALGTAGTDLLRLGQLGMNVNRLANPPQQPQAPEQVSVQRATPGRAQAPQAAQSRPMMNPGIQAALQRIAAARLSPAGGGIVGSF